MQSRAATGAGCSCRGRKADRECAWRTTILYSLLQVVWPHLTTPEKIALISAVAGSVSALIALFAALRSSRANRISLEALELAKRAFSITVKSERGEDCLVLSAVGSEQQINNLVIYFPGKLGLDSIALISGNLKLFDQRIAPALRGYWDSHTPTSKENSYARPNVPVPVVIEVHGHSKGVATVTKGIYDLYAEYIRIKGKSSLKVQALALNNYAHPNDDPQQLADQILAQIEATVLHQAG